MTLYWTMFYVPFLGAIFLKRISINSRIAFNIVLFFTLVIIIGFRKEVGGDWFTYIGLYENYIPGIFDGTNIIRMNFLYDALFELGYVHGLGMQFINTSCAIIFVSGILIFCNPTKEFLSRNFNIGSILDNSCRYGVYAAKRCNRIDSCCYFIFEKENIWGFLLLLFLPHYFINHHW